MRIATIFIICVFSFVVVDARENYLYHGHNDTSPVLEFFIAERDGEAVGPSHPSYPSYLNSTSHGPQGQVVEFYSPFCGHCQHYKPYYIQLAKDVRATAEGKDVMFHAISCMAHREICRSENIGRYPTIKIFQAGNSTGILARQDFNVSQVLSALGIDWKEGLDSTSQLEPISEEEKEMAKPLIRSKSSVKSGARVARESRRSKESVDESLEFAPNRVVTLLAAVFLGAVFCLVKRHRGKIRYGRWGKCDHCHSS